MKIKIVVHMLLLTAMSTAWAQILVQSDVSAVQPAISRDEKGFSACGVRAVISVFNGTATAHAYDFSINAYAESFAGLIKAGRLNVKLPYKPGQQLAASMPAPLGFWIAAQDQGVPTRPVKIVAAESPGFVLGTVPIEQAIHGIFDIARGNQMQFAVRYADEKVDRVISFKKEMVGEDMNALQSCMAGLIARLKEKAESIKE